MEQDTNADMDNAPKQDTKENVSALPQASPKKVKILDTSYTKSSNLVEWKVQFEAGNQLVLAIPGEELGYLLGFDFVFNTDLILQACKAFKGKEKFLLLCSDESILPDKIDKEISEEDEFLLDSKMHDYPFDRVMGSIYEGNIENLRNKLVEDVNSSLKDYGCKIQIIKKENIVLPQKFHFLGMWKNLGKKAISSGIIDDMFNIIAGISSKHGLVAERLDDFEDGFFTLRPQV